VVFLTVLKLVLLGGVLLLTSGCTNFLFQPVRETLFNPSERGIQVEDIFLDNKQGIRLHGWHLPSQEKTKGILLFFHGNGENISSHVGSVFWLPRQGYDVYLFDYRGYGRSGGVPEINGIVQDTVQMLKYAVSIARQSGLKLYVLGHSLGGSLAITATARLDDKLKVTALITANAFSDYRQVTRDVLSQHWLTRLIRWPLSLSISNRYRPLDVIKDISPVPVYILHSDADKIIPAHHADALYTAASQPKYRVNTVGGHNQNFALPENRKLLLEILTSQ
jgi:alpha-beta hydrolase superfamily lysophospholipase